VTPEPKVCVTCGRAFAWRKKWERDWEHVKHCSARCRRKLDATDRALEDTILALLAKRARTSSICPSDAARQVAPDDWRPLMERAREAARRLVARGEIVITQKGQTVDPSAFRGPIRLKRI
jgi:hypothetical protein